MGWRGNMGRRPSDARLSLRHVRAAQLRTRAVRFGIGKSFLGMVFLVGALAYARGPDPRASSSTTWMAFLVILSTLHVGLGLRTFAKVHSLASRLWWVVTLVWGGLSVALLWLLIR